MKKSLIQKIMSVCISLLLVMCQIPVAADNNPAAEKVYGQISAVYSYDQQNFGLSGTYNMVTNLSNNSITRIYSNGSVTGHGAINQGQPDNTVFIPTSISFYNSNGVVGETADLLTNSFQLFDFTGQLIETFTRVDKHSFTGMTNDEWSAYFADVNKDNYYYYYSSVNRNQSNGSYRVTLTGEMSDLTTNTVYTVADVAAAQGIDVNDVAVLQTFVNSVNAERPSASSPLTANDPYPFISSEQFYDSTARLQKVVTYGLNNTNSGSQASGEVDYSYVGPNLNKAITYEYSTDNQGNITTDLAQATISAVAVYSGNNNEQTIIKLIPGSPQGSDDWSNYNTPNSNSLYYLGQQYVYDGVKLTSMNTYDSTSDHNIIQVTDYDIFGRESQVWDTATDPSNTSGQNNLIAAYFYNDTVNPASVVSADGSVSATCVPGGVQYTVNYTYGPSGGDYISADETFYSDGDQTKPAFAIHIDNPTAIADLIAPNAPTDMTLDWSNNVIAGTITLGGTAISSPNPPNSDGSLTLAINDPTNFLAVINALQLSIDEGTALSGVVSALVQRWQVSGGSGLSQTGANNAANQPTWVFVDTAGSAIPAGSAAPGTISVKLGVIALPTTPTSPTSVTASTEYVGTGTAQEPGIFSASNFVTLFNWVKSLATQLLNGTYNNPVTANLTCNYWAVDASGNIWAFTNAVTDSTNATIL